MKMMKWLIRALQKEKVVVFPLVKSLNICVCCCHCSFEPVGGAAERHEGWRDPATGHAFQGPAHHRPPADVRAEHPQPTGQQGHWDAHAPGQQPASTHSTHTNRHTFMSRPAKAACAQWRNNRWKAANENTESITLSPTCASSLRSCVRQHFFYCSIKVLRVFFFTVTPNERKSLKTLFFSLYSTYLQDPTPPLRTTAPPSPPPRRAPCTWEVPTTVRCRLDPSYQVSV